ncbi:pectinesterase [Genlisea aurea]|uniref:Pectinesterase n=1 Tax=Genlisea aurea TaxID=192259 RepID=S8CI67_9LAMI|nr:pectinesterase [Genlisea aurea]
MAAFRIPCFLFLLLSLSFPGSSSSSSSLSSSTLRSREINGVCKTTPFPETCIESLKLSLSLNIPTTILASLLQTLRIAVTEGGKLSNLLSGAALVERQRGTLQDCRELHGITISLLSKSISRIGSIADARKLADVRTFLSAALTNRGTCFEGLSSAGGRDKPAILASFDSVYKYVSNSLSWVSNPGLIRVGKNRRLLGKYRRILQSSGQILTVAADGSGNFTAVADAVNFAPSNSNERVVIYVKAGVYEENVDIPSWKTNIALIGDGKDATVITGNRSVADGWTTFRSATVAVSGDGFLARDIRFENTAGPEKHQAVALRINADYAAVYRSTIVGYQDTLYAHSLRQFFRECDIYGTVDYIFGNAAVVFQACNIISRMPMPSQFTVITAQGREDPDQNTGISLQNCTILATDDLYSNSSTVKSYLGRPWKNYSRTVVIESYVDDFVAPEGWTNWSGDQGLDTLYYGEYQNNGPGSGTDGRVSWAGFHLMNYSDAAHFTVSEFITGQEWLDSTSVPYDDYV